MVAGDYNAEDQMGKVTVVNHEGSEITLSMVKWGWPRRLMLSLGKKLRIFNRFSIALFVPKYEIAIYDGGSRVVFSQKPYIMFYYPDAGAASSKWNELATIFERGGLYGDELQDFIRAGHPREQGVLLIERFHDQIERLFR
jgi:hypothetical protein